ncbi:hypothetical protein [Kutzneria buriramensis]|uniref:Uncharacterized protein n=1 Tax=Kutzneria buriramensis TaxID=1045776 RepID=A0A3E0H106_9PSEU|nr:hypothetical protein [Kutzneria buriramensis]REH35291.1 hypothetical protein BCF44_118151 [Kutzneria buriramensis]
MRLAGAALSVVLAGSLALGASQVARTDAAAPTAERNVVEVTHVDASAIAQFTTMIWMGNTSGAISCLFKVLPGHEVGEVMRSM